MTINVGKSIIQLVDELLNAGWRQLVNGCSILVGNIAKLIQVKLLIPNNAYLMLSSCLPWDKYSRGQVGRTKIQLVVEL